MRKLLFFLFLLPLQVYPAELSKDAVISVLTCAPGDQLYSQFGHSGIRIKDTAQHIDIVFNYGTFDFETPNFYLKFARGKLNYKLAVNSFKDFKKTYILEERSIVEQKLNLDSLGKQKLFDALKENYKPENRYYKYDFFYDNCATRVRDIIEKNIDTQIAFNYSETEGESFTFREMINQYLARSQWIRFGLSLILGIPADKKAEPYQYMFLPDYIMYSLKGARNDNENFTEPGQTIFKANPDFQKTKWYFSPVFFASCFAFICLLLLISQKKFRYFYFLIYLLAGMAGILIIMLWFFTDHSATKWNLHLLWAFPLHFFIAFYLLKKFIPFWIRLYFFIFLIIGVCLMLGFCILPQHFDWATLPLLLAFNFCALKIVRR